MPKAKSTTIQPVTEQQVYDAVHIILSDEQKFNTQLNYAFDYALTALNMHGHALAVQCLYILNNISYWRHEKAKEVRAVLKAFAAQDKG